MSTGLYTRIVSMDYGDPERSDLMAKVWGVTPFVVNVRTGSPGEDVYRDIIQWARAALGPQAMPIHGHDGNWQTGSATVFGETFIGFKHEIDLGRFSEAFGHLIIADQTSSEAPSGANADPCRAPLCDCSMGAAERCGRPGGADQPPQQHLEPPHPPPMEVRMAGELVERLRKISRVLREYGWGSEMVSPPDEAADRIEALERENATLRAERDEARKALETSVVALDDWLVTYSSDMCKVESVDKALERIRSNGGTLSYIADVQALNRAAIRNMGGEG